MTQGQQLVRVAILDDYQEAALKFADWSQLQGRAEIVVFKEPFSSTGEVMEKLKPFDVLCVMRERTPLTRQIIEKLPNLKLIASTGPGNQSIDTDAASEKGIDVRHTRYWSTPTVELTWALILGLARNLTQEVRSLQEGGWQRTVGHELSGKTLGLLGLGRVGSAVGAIGKAFGMNVVAWSQNLTDAGAREHGVRRVTRDEIFELSDYLSVHLRLSPRSEHLIGDREFAQMKRSARLINTSRAGIVDQAALHTALTEGKIAGAALDVFEVEPVKRPHSLVELPNVLATPHIGFVSEELYRAFYSDTVKNVHEWLAKRESRVASAG
jgi:phosphoglycerate dehydrogenase-like enzyme